MEQTENPSRDGENLLTLLHQASRIATRSFQRKTQASHAQGLVLGILAQEGAISQRALQDMLNVRSGSLSEFLGKLERDGLIERTRNENDKRSVTLSLTDAGVEALKAWEKEASAHADNIFSSLSAEERASLTDMLERMIVALGSAGHHGCCGGHDDDEEEGCGCGGGGHGHGHHHGEEGCGCGGHGHGHHGHHHGKEGGCCGGHGHCHEDAHEEV